MKTLATYLEEFDERFNCNGGVDTTVDILRDFLSTMYRELEEAKDEELREQAEQNDFNNS